MAVFDTVRCFYSLPFQRARQWVFQTRDTPDVGMSHYIIRADGQLWRDASERVWQSPSPSALHAHFAVRHPRWEPAVFSGSMVLSAPSGGDLWLTLNALFERGYVKAMDVPDENKISLSAGDWAYLNERLASPDALERNAKFKEAMRRHAAMVSAQRQEQRAFSEKVAAIADVLTPFAAEVGWGEADALLPLLQAAASSVVRDWDTGLNAGRGEKWLRDELAKWWGEQAVESLGELSDAVADIEGIMQSNTPDAVEASTNSTLARGWSYRVVRRVESGEAVFGIHVVHYVDGKIAAWSEREARPSGESLAQLRHDLQRMTAALRMAVLEERQVDGKSTLVETDRA